MAQDQSQKFFLWGILLVVGVFIFVWLLNRRSLYCQNQCWKCDENSSSKEGYSPYRNTGGCSSRTGWTYLDRYDQEDFYRKYPYVYPTPTNYVRQWYANRRANDNFLESVRGKMEEHLRKEGESAYV